MARRLGEPDAPRDDRVEDEVAEVPAHLRRDVGGEPRAAVDHRQEHAGDRQARVQPRPDELDRVEQLGEPLERVVLALHRDEDAVGGRERVDRQRAERRRAVDEDEGVALARRRERVAEEGLAVLAAGELDRGAGEVGSRRDEVEVGKPGRVHELLERRAVEEVVGRGAVRPLAEPRGRVRLRVEVDDERRARRPPRGRRRG